MNASGAGRDNQRATEDPFVDSREHRGLRGSFLLVQVVAFFGAEYCRQRVARAQQSLTGRTKIPSDVREATTDKPAWRARASRERGAATSDGPSSTARRSPAGVSPLGLWITYPALRLPGLSTRWHFLSTESLFGSQQNTSAWTMASTEVERNGSRQPSAATTWR